ncbi:MAG TPA: hypothetical protein VGE12_13630 [Noviherbaspirillum sp.]
MGWFKQSHERSMLGQLLVSRKLISEEQLAQAIAHQRKTGQRLGDIFAEWNIVTQKHLQDALHAQRTLRLAASLAAALLAPLEAFASAPLPPPTHAAASAAPQRSGGMRALSEEDLGQTSAQGLSEDLVRRISDNRSKDAGLAALGGLAQAFNPLLGLLQADVTLKDVAYDPASATSVINADGSITLRMPSTIGELSFEHIRIRGAAPDAPSFGTITMRDIDLRGTTITVRPK